MVSRPWAAGYFCERLLFITPAFAPQNRPLRGLVAALVERHFYNGVNGCQLIYQTG
jgi:hypothetical protein